MLKWHTDFTVLLKKINRHFILTKSIARLKQSLKITISKSILML